MKKQIAKILKNAILKLQREVGLGDFEIPEIIIDYPKEDKFGDYTSNIAMILAKKIGKNPMEIANQIAELLNGQIADIDKNPSPTLSLEKGESKIPPFEKGGLRGIFAFEKIEVAVPGYINFYLSKKYLQNKIVEINDIGNDFGKSEIGKGIKINNEFISANPTGPLHLGNGRGGFYGDALSRILRKAGFEVVNEYYVNDAGEQIEKLGHSIKKDGLGVYSGEYLDKIDVDKTQSIKLVGIDASGTILDTLIIPTIQGKMQISFDNWASEREIQDEKYDERALNILKEKKLTYESEGALWLKTTEFGDDKDRVLVKSNGQKTYFASDCGYILNKIERGFDQIIEIWGADHHGYINRFKAAAEALGFSKEKIKFIIVQLVRLMKNGKEARMSKRAGNVIYIDELINKVGHDVVRFFFLMYSPDTHMNFDLDLAEEHSQKNPVFYVQYAHARMCSIIQKAEETITGKPVTEDINFELLTHERELDLFKELNKFPELVEEITEIYAVQKLPQYAIKLADKFHSFYNACQVLDEDNLGMTRARLEVIKAAKIVLGETLNLIGVGAPEKM